MKRVLLLLLVLAITYSCKTEQPTLPPNTYQVNVTAKGVYNGMRAHIGIKERTQRNNILIDTAMVVNETFTFTGKVKNASLRALTINGIRGELFFVLEPGVTTIEFYKDSIHKSRITGGPNSEIYQQFKDEQALLNEEIQNVRQQLSQARRDNDTTLYNKIFEENKSLTDNANNFVYDFINKNADHDVALLLLESIVGTTRNDLSKMKESHANLEDVIAKNPANQLVGRKIAAFIAQREAVANTDIGKVAPEFTSTTPDGKSLALNDIKGKATIIDFWASWCGPCRRENPNLVRIYDKYHDKGLEIIGVSLDRPNNKKRWLDAIEKDGLKWHQVSSLQYFNDPVAKKYSVNSIPAAFILDENGVIVAKKLRGAALEQQIASMLE